ncbi:MAG: UDP-2,3-diacylglucosamine diphosphatase [Pseudohongiellaceae bacterium]
MEKKTYRAIWISDVHLGTRDCKAALLNSFLKAHRCEKLYLVGDIIDGWRIATAKWYWPAEHNRVVRQVLRKAEKENTRVYYITGNHDEFLRDYIAEHKIQMGNIQVLNEVFHTTVKGEKIWVVHGDDYDGVTRYHKWVAFAGDLGYNFLLWSNHWVNILRKVFRLPYWSMSRAIKNKVRKSLDFISEFENTVVREAGKYCVQGVICGHIHCAGKKQINGINYYNCGDWVDSCTALVEDDKGKISIIHWADENQDFGKVISFTEHSGKKEVVNL